MKNFKSTEQLKEEYKEHSNTLRLSSQMNVPRFCLVCAQSNSSSIVILDVFWHISSKNKNILLCNHRKQCYLLHSLYPNFTIYPSTIMSFKVAFENLTQGSVSGYSSHLVVLSCRLSLFTLEQFPGLFVVCYAIDVFKESRPVISAGSQNLIRITLTTFDKNTTQVIDNVSSLNHIGRFILSVSVIIGNNKFDPLVEVGLLDFSAVRVLLPICS